MDEILNPWIEGGPNRDRKIAEGIESIWDFGGAEDLYKKFCMLLGYTLKTVSIIAKI